MVGVGRRDASAGSGRGFDERLDVLKTRTLQVVLCVIEGDDVRRTAEYLKLSPSTVRRNLELAKRVLGCPDVGELRRRYAAWGRQAA